MPAAKAAMTRSAAPMPIHLYLCFIFHPAFRNLYHYIGNYIRPAQSAAHLLGGHTLARRSLICLRILIHKLADAFKGNNHAQNQQKNSEHQLQRIAEYKLA